MRQYRQLLAAGQLPGDRRDGNIVGAIAGIPE
jgi:hypothetical protein